MDTNTDGSLIVTAEYYDGIRLYHKNGTEINSTKFPYNNSDYVVTCRFSKDDSMIAYAGWRSSPNRSVITVVDGNLDLIRTISTNFSYISKIDFSYDNTKIIACGYNNRYSSWSSCCGTYYYTTYKVQIYSATTGTPLEYLTYSYKPLTCRFAPNG